MQGYEQGRVPALSPVVHLANHLLKVGEARCVPVLSAGVHVGEPVLSPAQPTFIEISPCSGYLYDYACHRVHSRGSILDDRFVGESSQ